MRVFVTGATGWVGSATVQDLIAAGHSVLGMARSDEGMAAVTAAGATAHRGSLQDLDSLKAGVAQCDGVIHLAFSHDFANFAQNGLDEQHAIAALGEALDGTAKPLVATSGVALLTPGVLATEDAQPRHTGDIPRNPEGAVAALVARGIKATVVRLSPSVHGHGDHGFVPILINIARQTGVAAYIGDGANRWPGVHRLDAARLYRLALEHGAEDGPFHGVAEEGVPMRQITEVIARRLNLPLKSISPDEAAGHFGWFARFAGIDAPASSARTRARLGWTPTHPDLLADLDHPAYFS